MLVLISVRHSQALQLGKHISSEVKEHLFKVITACGKISTIKLLATSLLVFRNTLSSCALALGDTKPLTQILHP